MFKKLILPILLITLFIPLSGFAADLEKDEGTITINILDETGADFSGRWYLRTGGINGYLVRNGSTSETFNFKKGIYYLELQPKYPEHTYYTVFSANPQTLIAGGSIEFDAQYFTEKDDLDDAVAAGKPTISTTQTSTTTSTTSSTTSSTSTTTSSPSTSTTSTTSTTTSGTTTKKIHYYYVPAATFETPPPESSASASTTSESSTASSATSSESSGLGGVPQLAATGPGLLLFALAPLLGGMVIRRKKQ